MSPQSSFRNISVIGLGHLGAPFLVALASRGFKVIGVDTNPDVIKAINQTNTYLQEPQYAQLLKRYRHRLSATTSYSQAIKNSDITFIIVPTPSKADKSFTNKYIVQAINSIGPEINKKSTYHLVAIVSTVSPQSLAQQLAPQLEAATGKKIGSQLGFCYNPTFIALGQVISNILKPDFVLVGESDKKAGNILRKFYHRLCLNQPQVQCMNWINAEITKLALNTFVTTKISYANMLAQLCDRLPSADAQVITQAIGLDSRIGLKYLQPGPPYGGPCFPRDNQALIAVGKQANLQLPLAQATDQLNQQHFKFILRKIIQTVSVKSHITIIGIAYKQDTNVIDESFGYKLAQALVKKQFRLSVCDPLVKPHQFTSKLNSQIKFHAHLNPALKHAQVIILASKNHYHSRLIRWLKNCPKNITVFDCWRIVPAHKLNPLVNLVSLGKNSG